MNDQVQVAAPMNQTVIGSGVRGTNVVIIDSMPIEEYHDDFGSISSSGLKTLIFQSPGHYKAGVDERRKAQQERREAAEKLEKERAEKAAAGVPVDQEEVPAEAPATAKVEPSDGTEATNFGTAAHALLLEPEEFYAQYVTIKKFDRRTKLGKAGYADFVSANKGKKLVTEDDFKMMEKIILNINNHALAKRLLDGGVKEQSIFWTDPRTGVRLRIRPDLRSPHAIVDLKSTKDASREGFKWEARKYGYDLSAAMYQDGCFHAFGEELPFAFLAAEKTGPCAVALYPACQAMLEEGYNWYRKAVEKYAQCLETDHWPLYQDGTEYEEMLWVPRR